MVLPLAAIAVICALDIVLGRERYVTPILVVVPALAALTTTWRRTLVVGVLGMAARFALAPHDRALDPPSRPLFAGQVIAYVLVSLFSVYIAWRSETGRRAFAVVTSVAEAAQMALLRPPGPEVGCMRLAIRYVSAQDAAQIGGDLYAVLDTPYGVRTLVADVRGKGLDAVQTAGVALGSFREAAYDEECLTRVAERVDASVSRHVDEGEGEFATALFTEFRDPGSLALLHYGHVAALRVGADGEVAVLDPPDPWVPLGLSSYAEGVPKTWTESFRPDDVLVLHTDGVIEARGAADGSFYPLADRAGPLVAGSAQDLEAAVDRLYSDLLRHTGGTLSDDAVLLLLAHS
jgi:serine phosphatase RsbU (regulator of sigma subunit)